MSEINSSKGEEEYLSLPQLCSFQQNSPLNLKEKMISKFVDFLKSHTIYQAIPENMKILVFNSRLTVKRAIHGMIREDIYCSLIYNSETQKMNGILTLRDVISLLSFIHDKYKQLKEQSQSISFFIKEIFNKNISINTLEIISEEKNEKTSSENQSLKSEAFGETNEIEEQSLDNGLLDQENKCLSQLSNALSLINIKDYMSNVKGILSNALYTIALDDTLYDCIIEIHKKKLHRLVIEDQKSKLYCGFITYESIFDFFIERYYSDMDEFSIKASEFNFITTHLITLNKDSSIYNCFELILSKGVSFVPIFDQENNELFGFVFIKDIIYLLSEAKQFSFNDSIEKFLILLYKGVNEKKPLGKERVVILDSIDIPIKSLFELMSISPERKIIVKEKEGFGAITLSNIFNILLPIDSKT